MQRKWNRVFTCLPPTSTRRGSIK